MGRETLKIVFSLVGAGVLALCMLVLTQAVLLSGNGPNRSAELFRFQISSMFALAIFAGAAIVIYARLSRYSPRARPAAGRRQEQSKAESKTESKDG